MRRTGSKTIIAELTRTKADVKALLKAEIAAHERTKARAGKAEDEIAAIVGALILEIEDMRMQADVDEGHDLKLPAFVLRDRASIIEGIANRTDVDVRYIAARVPLWRELHEAVSAEDWKHSGRVALVLEKLAALDKQGTP